MATWNRYHVRVGDNLVTHKGIKTKWTVADEPCLTPPKCGSYALLRCTCSKTQMVRLSAVFAGLSNGCSICAPEGRRRPWPAIGELIGNLVVLAVFASSEGTKINTKCQNCGHTKEQFLEVVRGAIAKGRPNVCSNCCWQRKTRPDTLGRYLSAMWKRKAPAFSMRQFEFIGKLPCFYCGVEPENIFRTRRRCATNVEIPYQGMDEVVYGLGHIIGNVLPCCIICNKAKNNKPLDVFCAWYNRRRSRSHHLSPTKIIAAAKQLGDRLQSV